MITRMSGAACVTASAVSRISRKIIGNCLTTAENPMIDSSSIGNSEASPSRAIDWPADAFELDGVAKPLAQHLHQVGAEPVAQFLRRDQKYLSRDVRGCRRRDHAGRPVTKRLAASAASIIGLRFDHDGIAGDDRNPGKLGRGRTLDGSRPHGRQIEAQILPALGRLHQHAARGPGANAAFRAQPGDTRQQAVGALDVFHPDHVTVDHDGGLTDVEGTERMQHLAPPGDVGSGIFVWRRPGEASLRHQEIRRDILDPDHPESVLFENAADPGQQMIVAAPEGGQHARR